MFRTVWVLPLMCWCMTALAEDNEGLEHVNFPLNSSVVVDAFQGLDLLADVMKKYPDLSLEVVGFTDNISSDSYNKNLSEKRAAGVKAYLVSRGVNGDRVTTLGRGETDFVSDNESREGRFQNRRVELWLYEMTDGSRSKVGYRRLIELFFGGIPKSQMVAIDNQDRIMQKLSELEKQQQALQDALDKKLSMMAAPVVSEDGKKKWSTASVSGGVQFNGFSGVSFDLGIDQNDDLTGRVTGQYFRAFTDSLGIQAQGEYTYFDTLQEAQFDGAIVYQVGHFKLGGAASYRMVDIQGMETGILGQGALVADFVFDRGYVGVFGTAGFDEGDVIRTDRINLSYVQETYLDVIDQIGVDFGVNIGDKAGLSGSVSSLDTDQSSDFAASLRFDLNITENFTWYIDLEMNDSLIANNDGERYATGIRLGSWGQARYMASDQVTPIQIPRLRYEMATRMTRVGNSSPIAEAGPTQTNVAAGTVTLDGSASSDPEGDAISFKWGQLSGPAAEITNSDQAVATFVGEEGAAYSFILTVRDEHGAQDKDIVSVYMEAAPEEVFDPVINFLSAIPSEITEGEITNLSWSTSHADTVVLEGMGEVNLSGSIIMEPTQSTVFTLRATNAQGTVTETVSVTVTPLEEEEPNTAPVAVAGPDVILQGEGTVMLDGSASFDPDDDPLTYLWIQLDGEVVELAGADTTNPTFLGKVGRSYKFRIVVTDGRGGIDTDDVIVQVF